jgi:uncharacterized protein (UPF0216 family)
VIGREDRKKILDVRKRMIEAHLPRKEDSIREILRLDPPRIARIARYAARAALGLPLFE